MGVKRATKPKKILASSQRRLAAALGVTDRMVRKLLDRDDWPQIEGEATYFQMAEKPLDMAAFERLTDGFKKCIEESPEWTAMCGHLAASVGNGSTADDDIPF